MKKIKEIGVEDFRTILEVQPRYEETYDALRINLQGLVAKEHWTRAEDKKRDSLNKSINHKIASLLEEHLHALGLSLEFDQEEKIYLNVAAQRAPIMVNLPYLPIYPSRDSPIFIDGYKPQLHLHLQKERTFQVEVLFEQQGRHELRYVSDGLCLLFPKVYNGIGIPAVRYISKQSQVQVVPLSRVPQVIEHMQALGKALYPHLEDLDRIHELLMKLDKPATPPAEKRLQDTLQREYLCTLVEAMGREINSSLG